jgi:hypothetical protein
MESDGLYRFVVLRSVELTSREAPADPFVNAYGAADVTQLLSGVSNAFAANDLAEAQSLCSTFIHDLQLEGGNPWKLAPPLRAIAAPLAILTRQGSAEGADKLLESQGGEDAGSHSLSYVSSTRSDLRSQLADLLLCQALLPDSKIPAESTAQMILCIETFERLRAPDANGKPAPRRLAWRIPLSRGRVYLPLQLDPLAETPMVARRAAHRGGPRVLAFVPNPPRKWMGDLILLRQKVRGYSLGEIAHVENVLLNESFKRRFRTTNKTEQTLTTETDVTRESERDLQSTTRDELRTEIQKAKSEDLSLSANFNVQASYNGGSYSVVAGAGGSASYRRASEEREDTSISHAREVVDKAVERVSERMHTIQATMTSHEEEDIAEHGIDNADGDDHIVGVYRWLEKRVDLHLINYGRRLIYELMIPEPATFWARLVTQRGDGSAGPPPSFPALPPPAGGGQPADLTPLDFSLRNGNNLLPTPNGWTNLQRLAGEWGVQLEDPPPLRSSPTFPSPWMARTRPTRTKTSTRSKTPKATSSSTSRPTSSAADRRRSLRCPMAT